MNISFIGKLSAIACSEFFRRIWSSNSVQSLEHLAQELAMNGWICMELFLVASFCNKDKGGNKNFATF